MGKRRELMCWGRREQAKQVMFMMTSGVRARDAAPLMNRACVLLPACSAVHCMPAPQAAAHNGHQSLEAGPDEHTHLHRGVSEERGRT